MVAFAVFNGLHHYTRLHITRRWAERFHLTAVCAWLRWARWKVQQQPLVSSTNKPSMPKSWGQIRSRPCQKDNYFISNKVKRLQSFKISKRNTERFHCAEKFNGSGKGQTNNSAYFCTCDLWTLLPDVEWLLDLAFLTDETEELNNPEVEDSQRQSLWCYIWRRAGTPLVSNLRTDLLTLWARSPVSLSWARVSQSFLNRWQSSSLSHTKMSGFSEANGCKKVTLHLLRSPETCYHL